MAKRRKSASKRKGGRRIGASSGGAMSSVLGLVAGAAAAKLVGNALPASMNDKVRAAVPLAVGLFLPRFVKGKFVADLSAGMVAGGGLGLVQSFNLPMLSGIGAYPLLPAPSVAGYPDSAAPMIAGMGATNTQAVAAMC
jgi:hypothetical protein